MPAVLYLSRTVVEPLLKMEEALEYAEEGFRLYGKSRRSVIEASFSPMVAFHTKVPNSDIDYRAGAIESIPTLCSTLGFGYGDNPSKHSLPSMHALAVLTDLETGVPLAVMDGYYLSYLRTAAAAAVASKYLAKASPREVGFVGAGSLGRINLRAHLAQYGRVDVAKVWSRSAATREKFAAEASQDLGLNVKAVEDAGEAVRGSDIVYCATRSREPIVMSKWVAPGMHINAFGSDSPGKQELDPEILRKAKIFVDSLEQCKIGGQIHKPLADGVITEGNIHAEFGEIVNGWKKGRESDAEITVMDSTGLAALDVVIFYHAYEKAKAEGLGVALEF